MTKGDRRKEIKVGPESANEAVLLWRKGWELFEKKEEEEEKRLDKFQSTLEAVAEVLEEHHAQRSVYFRDAVPYPSGKFMVVDFPTQGNQLKRTQEEFRLVGKPCGITKLYHGTHLWRIPSIVKRGLLRSRGGMLGRGIYFGSIHKAEGYTDLVILECKVILGDCNELEQVERFGRERLGGKLDWDSMHARQGDLPGVHKGFLRNEEWVVRYPKQVEIYRLICLK